MKIYLAPMEGLTGYIFRNAFNEIYGRYFTSLPSRSCVAVKTLPKNVLAEVEVIAEV